MVDVDKWRAHMRALSSSKTVTAVPCAMRSCEIAVVSGAAMR